jgi:transketolase N-terminal domain/subunit
MSKEVDFQALILDTRKKIIENSYLANACHIGSALSVVEIMVALSQMKGKVFFSKASGAATVYALENRNAKYLKENPLLWPGGSLGHGLPISVGYALANRNEKVYCVMSDAEIQEGTTWESLSFASQHKLSNLIVILDKNDLQACGKVEDILSYGDLKIRVASFGWEVRKVDGHDYNSLNKALTYPPLYKEAPVFIIADTIKGKGISWMEDKVEWHYKNLNSKTYAEAMAELK